MATKKVTVVISDAPSADVAERLRMTVGLTLHDDNEICVLLVGDGVYVALGIDHEKTGMKELDKSFEMFSVLGVKTVAHAGSVQERGVSMEKFGVVEVDDDKVKKLMSESAIVFA